MTRRNLTRTSDRIYALAGLASWIHDTTDSSYCIGLWRDDLDSQLLWYSDISRSACPAPQRLPQPYAPSWAWPCISGPVAFFKSSSADLPVALSEYAGPDFHSVSVQPLLGLDTQVWGMGLTSNRYGPTFMALLQSTARVLPVYFYKSTDTWVPEYPVADFDSAALKFYIDAPAEGPAYTKNDPNRPMKYWLILAGKFQESGGYTPIQLQAVCLLTRRMTSYEDQILVTQAYLTFCLGISKHGDKDYRYENKNLATADKNVDLNLARVGIVRGAGSIRAWAEAVPETKFNLY
ncbi:hypothetical protein N7478_003579 [Penicillium angulare]|uniref:uncharacterized protein n=1 Tax=Penicillium angulare TaxID=116970 RepID=UPI0025415C81|nr:uncharacterized protein N7478_003579 [Penicillium angulare]KAJ5287893.1 hypothetical protein N7478_003579 [Penicillium angulare]